MPRPRRESSVRVSLFPFLSVLACVIGTLTLLISGLTVGAMGAAQEPPVDDAEDYAPLREAVEKKRSQVSHLRKLIDEAEATVKALAEARAELERLQGQTGTRGMESRQILDRLRRIAELRRRVAELEAELKAIQEQIQRLEETLREKGKGTTIEIVPGIRGGRSRVKSIHTFVECTADSLIIHPERPHIGSAEGTRLRIVGFARSKGWRDMIRRVRRRRDGIVTFLIREDGVRTFEAARKQAKLAGVRVAHLPLPGDGKVDLRQLPYRTGGAGTRRR